MLTPRIELVPEGDKKGVAGCVMKRDLRERHFLAGFAARVCGAASHCHQCQKRPMIMSKETYYSLFPRKPHLPTPCSGRSAAPAMSCTRL